MTKLTDVQRAFLAGLRRGRSLARKRAQRDAEELMEELRERDDAAQQSVVRSDPEEP